jgi:hypothetical protein
MSQKVPLLSLLVLCACSHSATAPKPKPRPDPYELIYVVDDFLPPIDTMHVTFSLTDSSEGVFGFTQEYILNDTLAGHSVACFALGDTLGQRLLTVSAATDTGGPTLHYQIPTFDPAAGVDTTGGAGLTPSTPWVWHWRIGDSTMTGFARPASWGSFCSF